jgi:hypothetical protein
MRTFLQIKDYNWIKEVKSSDHRPVVAIFDLNVPKNSTSEKGKSTNLKNSKACLIF